MVIVTKEILDSEKPILVRNILPSKFSGGITKQGLIGNMQGDWDPDRSVRGCTEGGGFVGHCNELKEISDLFRT